MCQDHNESDKTELCKRWVIRTRESKCWGVCESVSQKQPCKCRVCVWWEKETVWAGRTIQRHHWLYHVFWDDLEFILWLVCVSTAYLLWLCCVCPWCFIACHTQWGISSHGGLRLYSGSRRRKRRCHVNREGEGKSRSADTYMSLYQASTEIMWEANTLANTASTDTHTYTLKSDNLKDQQINLDLN